MFDIVCLGEVLIDMFPLEADLPLEEVSAFRPVPGGAPANVAVAAAKQGARSAFIGKVGADPFGRHLQETLNKQGVETRGMRFDAEARTGLNFHARANAQSATHLFYRNPSADMRLSAEELDLSLLQNTRAYHFGTMSLIQDPSREATLEALRIAREAGALISLDVNYRGSLWSNVEDFRAQVLSLLPLIDLMKVNQDEAALLTGRSKPEEAIQQLSTMGSMLCVMTLGEQGSMYFSGGKSELVPGFKVQAVEATGSGDAFMATVLLQLVSLADKDSNNLDSQQLHTILRRANAAGALTALAPGVFSALPTADEIQQLLK
jgi:fructokinase